MALPEIHIYSALLNHTVGMSRSTFSVLDLLVLRLLFSFPSSSPALGWEVLQPCFFALHCSAANVCYIFLTFQVDSDDP